MVITILDQDYLFISMIHLDVSYWKQRYRMSNSAGVLISVLIDTMPI